MANLTKYYVLDANNNVVEAKLEAWGIWFSHIDNRVIGLTDITSQIRVSTVFIGIDHRFFGRGPPLLFETMIFGGPLDQYQRRYASYDDAQTGHQVAVRKAREAIGQKIKEPKEEKESKEC
jgi:hypothetical protein